MTIHFEQEKICLCWWYRFANSF